MCPTAFTVLKRLLAFESSTIAQEMTEKLLRDHPDLTGLCVAVGGITGALLALRNDGLDGWHAVTGDFASAGGHGRGGDSAHGARLYGQVENRQLYHHVAV